MKHHCWKLVLTAVLTLLLPAAGSVSAQEKQGGGPPPAKVVTSTVQERLVAENTRIIGTLSFDRMSSLSTEVSGLVAWANFREGDRISQGDPMIRLNTDFIDNEIETVEAGLKQVQVRLDKAEKDLARYETLFRQDATSEQEFDRILLAREELVQGRAILEKNLDLARLKKAKSVIRAPFDGVVLEKNTDLGTWVSPGNTLCVLGALDDLFVKVPVSEELIGFSEGSQPVNVEISTLRGIVQGTTDGLLPKADVQTRTVFLKVRLPRIAQAIENLSATVLVPVSEKRQMLVIPRDALGSFNGSPLFYTIREGQAAPVPVSIAAYVGQDVAITGEGLSAGMPVVVDGNARLRPGQAVTVINQQ